MNIALIPWFILLVPLLSAAAIVSVTRRAKNLSAMISTLSAVAICALSWVAFFGPETSGHFTWMHAGPVHLTLGFHLDGLAKTMMIVVTTVGALIHIYSLGYMAEDAGKSRFFAGLSLFMFSMLGIVFADNFAMMFIFWELVGVSSYLLIGHWFHQPAPPAAANKAFITNRLGDFGFMLGILTLWLHTGEFGFEGIRAHAENLDPWLLTLSALLIFCGAVGKSAQFPLHVWLPDAMEGPTPVSALIHAATMVAAGVYMLARTFFLIEAAPDAQTVIAWVGAITALMAALMATQQDDIKRVLAYSTLSQLGYMVMAVGCAAATAAMFHLFTHAFFKALLFLGAGAVIHAMHHEQNLWKMGGLKNRMPGVFLTFLVGTLALTGCPGLSGFFSKDMILIAAQEKGPAFFVIGLVTAFLTAFYMGRLMVVTFLGSARSGHAQKTHDIPSSMTLPLWVLAIFSAIAGYGFFAGHFFEFEHGESHGWTVPALATGVFVLGLAASWVIYRGQQKDPISIPIFARKFYIDEFYAGLIRWTHDLLAQCARWFDRWILDTGLVRGLAGGTWATGFVLRFLQMGNLQGYAVVFGLGVVALIYFVLFA